MKARDEEFGDLLNGESPPGGVSPGKQTKRSGAHWLLLAERAAISPNVVARPSIGQYED